MIVIKNKGKNKSTLFKNSHSVGGGRLTDNYNIVWKHVKIKTEKFKDTQRARPKSHKEVVESIL